jgi:hypothetical protein
MITHFEPVLSSGFFTDRATLAASLNASLTPLFFIAEHSLYPISICITE